MRGEGIKIKVLDVDYQDIEQRLANAGAQEVSECVLEEYFFEDEGKGIIETKLRKSEEEGSFLIYKTLLNSGRINTEDNPETPIKISDLEGMKKYLISMRSPFIMKVIKHRQSYDLEAIRVELEDFRVCELHGRVTGSRLIEVPPFLQIKGPNRETISEYLNRLGISEDQCKRWTTLQLVNHYADS